MCAMKRIFVFCLTIGVVIAMNDTEQSIGFPEPEEDPNLVNKDVSLV